MNNETKDDCFQELERINREIETVRHEVEEEQRRLSRYQMVHTDTENAAHNFSVSKTEAAGKNIDRGSCQLSSSNNFTKTYPRGRKYVVDNSKPRTDLEYDPLSNFSADLGSYSSSAKEQKYIKKRQDLKRTINTVHFDQKKLLGQQAHLSRPPSSEAVDDSNEDDVLIIDIPPSPEKKRGRSQKLASSPKTEPELVVKTQPILFDSPLPCISNAEVFIKDNQHLTDLSEEKESENISVLGNLDGCLEDQKGLSLQATFTEVENSLESLSASTNQQACRLDTFVVDKDKNIFLVESPQCDLPCSFVKMNPPFDPPQTNSLFYKAPVVNSGSQSGQHTMQAQTEQTAQHRIYNHCSPKQIMPLLESSSTMSGHLQDKTFKHSLCVEYKDTVEPFVSSDLAVKAQSEPSEQLLVKAGDEFITIESSSDEEELHYSEVDLSDSDPMEECYRIFMEANNENKGNEEQSDMSVSMPDTQEISM